MIDGEPKDAPCGPVRVVELECGLGAIALEATEVLAFDEVGSPGDRATNVIVLGERLGWLADGRSRAGVRLARDPSTRIIGIDRAAFVELDHDALHPVPAYLEGWGRATGVRSISSAGAHFVCLLEPSALSSRHP